LLPGIEALMAKKGWLFVLWGILLLPLGFTIQAIGLIKARFFNRVKKRLNAASSKSFITPWITPATNITNPAQRAVGTRSRISTKV